MKRVFSRITATILILGNLSACSSDPNTASEPGAIRVVAPLTNSDGKYSLETFELKSVQDVSTLSGAYARFFMSPKIENGRLAGLQPKTRFLRNAQGDYVPSDDLTQQLASIYSHMQRLALLDEELGAGGVNTWPRDIGIAVRMKDQAANGAFYDGGTDSILFVPYTEKELPIPINAGVLAHEHFHSLFFKLALGEPAYQVHTRGEFLSRLVTQEKESEMSERGEMPITRSNFSTLSEENLRTYFQMTITRSLNEGLADFWGWMYSGDPDFIAQSLPIFKAQRTLESQDVDSQKLLAGEDRIIKEIQRYYRDSIKEKFPGYISSFSYIFGTEFSRMLKRFSDLSAESRGLDPVAARKELGKVIIRVLPKIRQDIALLDIEFSKSSKIEKSIYTSAHFVESLASEVPNLNITECEYLAALVNSHACSENDGRVTLVQK